MLMIKRYCRGRCDRCRTEEEIDAHLGAEVEFDDGTAEFLCTAHLLEAMREECGEQQ